VRKKGVTMKEKRKIIRDLIHGYIEVDNGVEKIINAASFQRLKHIKQLTAQHLFPSANHTRFEHSLGVMKLAMEAYSQIEDELKLKLEEDNTDNIANRLTYLQLHLKYAALLHDVGHSPLSHIGEVFFDKAEILSKIKELIIINDEQKSPIKNGSKHELMSCYVVLKKFKVDLEDILKKHKSELDIEFILRIITGTKYDKSSWDKNLCISLVNGEPFDVDKMDYLLRDNYMTGNVGGYIDSQRMLCSLAIPDKRGLCFKISALSSLKKLVDCRDSLYMWVCNHHIVVYTDYLYKACLEHCISLLGEYEGAPLLTPHYPEIKEKKDLELFSCEAIAEKNVTDNDVYFYVNKVMHMVSQNKDIHHDTKTLLSQLLGRNFLKVSWKTLFEYSKFLDTIDAPRFEKEKISVFLEKSANIKKMEEHIRNDLEIGKYEMAFIAKNNKFYNDSIKKDINGSKHKDRILKLDFDNKENVEVNKKRI